jgi:hypothetical protein
MDASLGKALNDFDHLAIMHRSANFGNLQSELDAGRPMCVRIEWRGGTGHFLVVDGYYPETPENVHVRDPNPAIAPRWLPLEELRLRYRRDGHVTHVYETKAS